jgi:hypothetical protein
VDGLLTFLTGSSPAAIGWAIAGAAVWMILTGRLVPRSLYAEQKQSAETWRAAWQSERDHLTRLTIPNSELQRDVLRAIPKAISTPGPADSSAVGEESV